MTHNPFILIISEDAQFKTIDDDEDDRYGKYISHFKKFEAENPDLRILIKPPVAEALKGFHADLVLLDADVEEEFYDRYVKTRVARRKGAVIDLEI